MHGDVFIYPLPGVNAARTRELERGASEFLSFIFSEISDRFFLWVLDF